jgi:hypothetical protein
VKYKGQERPALGALPVDRGMMTLSPKRSMTVFSHSLLNWARIVSTCKWLQTMILLNAKVTDERSNKAGSFEGCVCAPRQDLHQQTVEE